MALEQYKTQVLLLHSQQRMLDSLSSGFNDRYSIHYATSGSEALNTLTETPIHVIVSAHKLPGMSGLDAIREAKKRSPETIGILLAGNTDDAGLEAVVGEQAVFEIVRGDITPEALRELIDSATRRIRMLALAESANDHAANVDEPAAQHIVMETSASGSSIVTDATGQLPALQRHTSQNNLVTSSRAVDVLVLTKDEEFLASIKDAARGLHDVHHSLTPTQAEDCVHKKNVGVLVTDAAMVGPNIEALTARLRSMTPRLVAIVAGRRDDGEMLMDLINRGHVYRFLLKPVSPGRARLAIEASTKHFLDGPDSAFKAAPQSDIEATGSRSVTPLTTSQITRTPQARSAPATARAHVDTPSAPSRPAPPSDGLDDAYIDDSAFLDTLAGLKTTMGHSISFAKATITANRSDGLGAIPDFGAQEFDDDDAPTGGWRRKTAVAGVLVIGVAVAYFMWQPTATTVSVPVPFPQTDSSRQSQGSAAAIGDEELISPAAPVAEQATQTTHLTLLEDARSARDAGQIFLPAGSNAIEMYGAALTASGDDPTIAAEFNDLLDTAFAMVEAALLERRLADAESALAAIGTAAAGNPRLAFLNAQFHQQKFRDMTDQARLAIRAGRYEDAALLLKQAQQIPGASARDLNLLSDELETARSEQRVDEVLALANQRVEDGSLISPPNNNARYYYELALDNDPQNAAAEQGLLVVASKLVLEARTAIDNGRLQQAAALLADAQVLDPASAELAAARRVLEGARSNRDGPAARQAEADREAEAARRAEAERQAERAANAEAERRAAALTTATVSKSGTESASRAPVVATQQNSTTPAAKTDRSEGDKPAEAALLAAATAASASLVANTATPDAAPVALQQNLQPPLEREAATPPVTGEPETVAINTLNRITYAAPKYPRNALRRNITGSVDVKFSVARDGSVFDVQVVDSTPGTVFDEAAIAAVEKWRFEPVIENGVAVEKQSAVRMAFDLQ